MLWWLPITKWFPVLHHGYNFVIVRNHNVNIWYAASYTHSLRTTVLRKSEQFIRKLKQILAFKIKSHNVLNILKIFIPSLPPPPSLSCYLSICMWRFGDNLWESVLSFHTVGLRDGTSGHKVWWQHLKSLSHLDGPLNIFQWVLLVDSFCVVEKQVITGLDYLCSKMALAKIYGWAFQLLTGDSPVQYYELILCMG